MNTNLLDAQKALYAALVAQSPTCRVSLGFPLGDRRNEELWVGLGARMEVTDEMTGGCARDEASTVSVFVWVEKQGGTPVATAERAYTILAFLEAALAADRTLGGVVEYAHVTALTTDDAYDQKAVAIGIKATVTLTSAVA